LLRGRADATASDTYNENQSQQRTLAVKRFIVKTFGISAENLIAVDLGKRELKYGNDPFAEEHCRVEVLNLWGGDNDRPR
jgi:outer membrane protein OmpA-like peptidoglycan-associated protein